MDIIRYTMMVLRWLRFITTVSIRYGNNTGNRENVSHHKNQKTTNIYLLKHSVIVLDIFYFVNVLGFSLIYIVRFMSFAIESSPYHSRHMNGIVWSDLLTLNETRQTVEIMASFYIYIYVYTHINLNKDAKIKPLGWIKNMSVHKSKRKKALAGKRPHPTPSSIQYVC